MLKYLFKLEIVFQNCLNNNILFSSILCSYYSIKKEIYKSTEFGFYPFFEEKAQYNWITENQVELKYTLDRTSDFSIAYIRNITFN